MPRRNRIDLWGDAHARTERGLFTGNRGCVVDDHQNVVRHHGGRLWITCLLRYRDWRVPLARPRRWTPLFFLDDVAALSAGHRPCALCRRPAYQQYRDAVTAELGRGGPLRAEDMDRMLAAERLRPGRGLTRGPDRITWTAAADALPDGAVVVVGGQPLALRADRAWAHSFGGWHTPVPRPDGEVRVLTPPTSVRALAGGFAPVWHPSAGE